MSFMEMFVYCILYGEVFFLLFSMSIIGGSTVYTILFPLSLCLQLAVRPSSSPSAGSVASHRGRLRTSTREETETG